MTNIPPARRTTTKHPSNNGSGAKPRPKTRTRRSSAPLARFRLDAEMARRGLADSREIAQRLIMAGRVRVNSRPAYKADLKVDSETPIALMAGGSADVHRELAFDREPEMLERSDQLVGAARGELRRTSHQRDVGFRINLEIGLVGGARVNADASCHDEALGDLAAVGQTAARHFGVEPEAGQWRRRAARPGL